MRTTNCYACGRYYVDVTSHACSGASQRPVATGSTLVGMPPAAALRKLRWYYASRSSMDTDATATHVPQADRQKWDTALANFMVYATGDDVRDLFSSTDAPVGSLTLANFARLKPFERIAIINSLWNRIAIWVKPNKNAADMFEPFPTDPVHFTSSHGNRVSGAWKSLVLDFAVRRWRIYNAYWTSESSLSTKVLASPKDWDTRSKGR